MNPLIPLNTLRPKDSRCTVFNTAPSKLSHYTSIETLELILKNKTIRFSRLDRVNDPKEAISADYANAQKLVFASCWSDPSTENMPLWEQYASQMTGVRISLPTLMFSGRRDNHKVTQDDRYYEIHIDNFSCRIDRRGKGVMALSPNGIMGPTKIRYLTNNALQATNVFETANGPLFDLRHLGTVKVNDWSWENEYRFRVLASFGYLTGKDGGNWMSPQSFIDTPVITEFVDVPLDPTCFDEAEIMLGPKMSEKDRRLVEQLCESYSPEAIITNSNIEIRQKSQQ